MRVQERLGFDPSALPITHLLLLNSVIWVQTKKLTSVFPQGILQTNELPVALVPKELARYHQRGQALFVVPEDQFDVYYPKYTATHTYYPPWILFGFLHPENKLTIPISKNQAHKDEEWKQDSF